MIRFAIGLFLVMGGVSGLDNPVDNSTTEFLIQMGIIIVGLLLMYFGTRKFQ